MSTCQRCGRDNPEGVSLCVYCGVPIDPIALIRKQRTRQLGGEDNAESPPDLDPSRFDERKRLLLRVIGSGQIIEVDVHQTDAIVLGRPDTGTGRLPDIDLTPYDGHDLGVSRTHASIRWGEGAFLNIHDLGSSNGSFLNGERLKPHQPSVLRDGDMLRLGRLNLQVLFVDGPEAPTRVFLGRSRGASDRTPVLVVRDLRLDANTLQAYRQDQVIQLTPKECDLLRCLMERPNQVLRSEELMEALWQYSPQNDLTAQLRKCVSNLRAKIERDSSRPQYIHSVRGVGYVIFS